MLNEFRQALNTRFPKLLLASAYEICDAARQAVAAQMAAVSIEPKSGAPEPVIPVPTLASEEAHKEYYYYRLAAGDVIEHAFRLTHPSGVSETVPVSKEQFVALKKAVSDFREALPLLPTAHAEAVSGLDDVAAAGQVKGSKRRPPRKGKKAR